MCNITGQRIPLEVVCIEIAASTPDSHGFKVGLFSLQQAFQTGQSSVLVIVQSSVYLKNFWKSICRYFEY